MSTDIHSSMREAAGKKMGCERGPGVLSCAAEGWPSGLRRRSRKAVRLKGRRGFESHPFRHDRPGGLAYRRSLVVRFCALACGILEESHRGLVGAPGKRVRRQRRRGFESHLLRHRCPAILVIPKSGHRICDGRLFLCCREEDQPKATRCRRPVSAWRPYRAAQRTESRRMPGLGRRRCSGRATPV